MQEQYNPWRAAELSQEQNTNMIDGVPNNTAPAPALPEPEKPKDKVKDYPDPRRGRDREER